MRHSSGIGVDIVPPMPTHRAPHASLPPPTFLMVLGKLPGKLPVVLTVLPYSAPLQCSYSPKVLLIPPVFLCSPAVVLVLPVLPYSAAHAPKVFLVPPCLLFSPKGLLCSAPLWCSVRSPPPPAAVLPGTTPCALGSCPPTGLPLPFGDSGITMPL